jgi:hypothetical protein
VTAQQFPLTGPINLDVRVSVGAIIVRAEDDVDTAEVELLPRREDSDVLARIRVNMDGRTLTIRGPKSKGWSLDRLDKLHGPTTGADIVDIHVLVPSGTSMKLASYGAQATVSGRAGSVLIATGAGTSTVERVDGDLVARFANATLDVARVDGSAVLRFNGGRAHLGDVAGDVMLACGNGDVDVDDARGSVRARTGAGAVTIARTAGDVDMSSGSGLLSVGLRPGQPARLDIATGHGRLISDLDVTDAEPVVEPGTAREPAITIRARTGSGDVRLFRANP